MEWTVHYFEAPDKFYRVNMGTILSIKLKTGGIESYVYYCKGRVS